MIIRVAAASQYRDIYKKPEKSTLAGDPKETLPPYLPVYLPLPSYCRCP
jgi:hypothetical protein